MIVRRFRRDDATALALILRRAIAGIGARDYSPAQCAAWAAYAPDAERIDALYADGRIALVAAEDDRPLAFGDVEPDAHIQFLYRDPEAPRHATALLYAALEAEARARGTARLTVEASEPARRFFLRRGFTALHRRDLEIGGVAIHNYAMEKRLTC